MIFETYRKHEELNYNITIKSVHFVELHYIIIVTHSIKNNVTTLLPLKKPQV